MQDESTASLNANDSHSTMVADPTPTEKMVPQSKVNDIIREVTARTAEKVRREAAEHQTATPTSTFDPAAISEIVRATMREEENARLVRQWEEEGHALARGIEKKIDSIRSKYADTDEVMRGMPLAKVPELVMLANEFDDGGEIMYHLAKNPEKAVTLKAIFSNVSPQKAKESMKQIADSLKTNESGKAIKMPKPPSDGLPPSTEGIAPNAEDMTPSDFAALFRSMRKR